MSEAPLELEAFVSECRRAADARTPLVELSYVVRQAVGRPPLAPFTNEGFGATVLHEAADLTVVQFAAPKGFAFLPHNHRMLSIVGVYAGTEDNVYFERRDGSLVETRRQRVGAGEVVAHDLDVIHSIASGADEPLFALHVYVGDFFRSPRSEWRGQPPAERPYDLGALRRLVSS